MPIAAPAQAQQLPIKTYTTAEGLPHNSINRIVKDSRGFLWFCTNEGLARFDSYTFTNFGIEQGLPNSAVNDLLETRAGEYWVATDGGLMRFDPRGSPGPRLTREKTSDNRVPMFSVVPVAGEVAAARAVTMVREGRDGTIWAGTDNGLYRLVRSSGLVSLRYVEVGFPNDNREQRLVADVLEDSRGSLWIAAPSGLYRRWPDGSAARYGQGDGLPNAYLRDLLEDHDGRLWAGTPIGGFFRFTADDSHRPPVVDLAFDVPDLPHRWVFQLLETSAHRFWIATARGLVEFFPAGDDSGRRFRAYSTRNGLSYFDITALAEDAGGNLWLGTNNAGAMKLALNGLTAYGEREGLRQVGTIFNDRAGNLCFRGLLLGDARASVFEGGRLDLVSTDQPGYYPQSRLLRRHPLHRIPATRHQAPGVGVGQRGAHAADAPGRMVDRHGARSLPFSRGRLPRRAPDVATACRLHAEGRPGDVADLSALRRLARRRVGVHHRIGNERPRPLGSYQWAGRRHGRFAGASLAQGYVATCVWRRCRRERVGGIRWSDGALSRRDVPVIHFRARRSDGSDTRHPQGSGRPALARIGATRVSSVSMGPERSDRRLSSTPRHKGWRAMTSKRLPMIPKAASTLQEAADVDSSWTPGADASGTLQQRTASLRGDFAQRSAIPPASCGSAPPPALPAWRRPRTDLLRRLPS